MIIKTKKIVLLFLFVFCFFSQSIGQTFSVSQTSKTFVFPTSSSVGYTTVTITNLTNTDLNMRWIIDFGTGIPAGWTVDFQVADSIYTGVLDSADFVLDTVPFNDQIVLFCFPNNQTGTVNAAIKLIDLNDPDPRNNMNITFSITATDGTKTNAVLAEQVKLFPNPTKGIFQITTPSTLKINSWLVVNSLGQTVLRETRNNSSNFDINHLNNGLYQIVLETNKGQIVKSILLN